MSRECRIYGMVWPTLARYHGGIGCLRGGTDNSHSGRHNSHAQTLSHVVDAREVEQHAQHGELGVLHPSSGSGCILCGALHTQLRWRLRARCWLNPSGDNVGGGLYCSGWGLHSFLPLLAKTAKEWRRQGRRVDRNNGSNGRPHCRHRHRLAGHRSCCAHYGSHLRGLSCFVRGAGGGLSKQI